MKLTLEMIKNLIEKELGDVLKEGNEEYSGYAAPKVNAHRRFIARKKERGEYIPPMEAGWPTQPVDDCLLAYGEMEFLLKDAYLYATRDRSVIRPYTVAYYKAEEIANQRLKEAYKIHKENPECEINADPKIRRLFQSVLKYLDPEK